MIWDDGVDGAWQGSSDGGDGAWQGGWDGSVGWDGGRHGGWVPMPEVGSTGDYIDQPRSRHLRPHTGPADGGRPAADTQDMPPGLRELQDLANTGELPLASARLPKAAMPPADAAAADAILPAAAVAMLLAATETQWAAQPGAQS